MDQTIMENSVNTWDFIEPAFYFGLNKSRKLPVYMVPECVINSFEYTLRRSPNDLSCHLQRIQFYMSGKNKDELFAAICDLFIILGTRGQPLRQRMLTYCKKALDQCQVEVLDSHLDGAHLTENSNFLPGKCFFKKDHVELIELYDCSDSAVKNYE